MAKVIDRIRRTAPDFADLVDVRNHVRISAEKRDLEGRHIAVYDHIGEKSGGESQELVAFIVGTALRYQLGDAGATRPRYAPVFLDEALIKADAHFTGRAIGAWRALGFQLVIGAPNDKHSAIEPHVDAEYLILKKLAGPILGEAPGRCFRRMSTLATPEDAVAAVRHKLNQRWAEAVCAELGDGEHVTFSVPLRPGLSTGKAVEQLVSCEVSGDAGRIVVSRFLTLIDCG